MKLLNLTVGLVCILLMSDFASAQLPAVSKAHKVLKMDEGNWDAQVTLWLGPDGPYEEPQTSTGKETNRMIGEFWIVSNFRGDFGGMPFTGHGQTGYDPGKKNYVGSWIDSFSPHATKTIGSWDADKNTMTFKTTSVGMDGKRTKGKNVVVYEGTNKRTMTMFMAMAGQDEMAKVMQIVYTRQ